VCARGGPRTLGARLHLCTNTSEHGHVIHAIKIVHDILGLFHRFVVILTKNEVVD